MWLPMFVPPDDERLTDRTGRTCIATTDPERHEIYVSRGLGAELPTVLAHEIGHAVLWEHGHLPTLRRLAPRSAWYHLEEGACNLLAHHSGEVVRALGQALGQGLG